MGKPKTHSKKAKQLAKKKGLQISGNNVKENPSASQEENGEKSVASKYTIDQILEKATEFMDTYNYEMAQKFCQRALEIDNDNVRALEITATLLLEAGDAENAKHCLGRAITVAPSIGHTKYLSLSQLLQGKESLELYNKAIEIITTTLGNLEPSPVNKVDDQTSNFPEGQQETLKRELSSAFCAVAELWMTDLCDESEAESECASSIDKAIQSDQSNAEAWQTKARLHLIKSEFKDARTSIHESLSKWLPSYTDVLESRPSTSGRKFDPVEVCPLLYTTRIATAKILIELEEWDSAIKVLDGLIEEDEQVVDTWYLLGWLNKLRADLETETSNGLKKNAKHENNSKHKEQLNNGDEDIVEGYISNARFYLNKSIAVHKKNPTDDDDLISHIEEILKEIGADDDENIDENDAEGNWEDYETDSEDDKNGMDQS